MKKKKCPNCGAIAEEKNNYREGEYSLRCEECGLVIEQDKYATVSNWDADNQELLDRIENI
ncbi:MAG: TFIIB-type zinc ribbon-containing protein [Nanoarchaeota archaeon]